MTHLDVYDDMDEIKACVAYSIDGKETSDFPSSAEKLGRAKPVLKSFTGWKKSITKTKSYDELPDEAKNYIAFIEGYTGSRVDIVSVGPDREQTFVRRPIW